MKTHVIDPPNPYLDLACSIIDHEIHPQSRITFHSEVDFTRIEAIRVRAARMDASKRKPSYTAFVVKALALALREFPYANRRVYRAPFPFARPRLQRFTQVDVCVACERQIPGAEMSAFVDVMRGADRLGLTKVATWLRTLAVADENNNKQWRELKHILGRYPSWLVALLVRLPVYVPSLWVKYRGGAAMVTAPGKYGVDVISGNWWSPIAVTFGEVKSRMSVGNGQAACRLGCTLTLNFDVRVMAGAAAARFFKRFVQILERVEFDEGEAEGEVKGETVDVMDTNVTKERLGVASGS